MAGGSGGGMRVVVAGATGLIGQRLSGMLLQAGHQLVVLSRDPLRVKIPCERVISWEAMEEGFPKEALEGADAVVYLSGQSIAGRPWTPDYKHELRHSRVGGTEAIAKTIGISSARPRVFVCASGVGYYGDRADEPLTEDKGPGSDFLSDLCRDWERAASLVEAFGVRRVSARFGVVFAREGGALDKMRPVFKLGVGGRLGSGKQYFPWIHVDDAAGLLLHAITHEAIRGPLNVVAPHQVTNAQFTRAFARALHRPAVMAVPAFAMKLAMGELGESLLASQRVVPKVATETGYQFRFPSVDGALADVA